MFKIQLRLNERFDEEKNEFVHDPFTLEMEHSLVSLSKWESKWEKPFLDDVERSAEELASYIECMVLNLDVPEDFLIHLTDEDLKSINEYIGSNQTATWFNDRSPKRKKPGGEKITSELVYYWMIAHQIPFECQHWHLNRLLTLIRICEIKNMPEKKNRMNTRDAAAERRALNERRLKELGTEG